MEIPKEGIPYLVIKGEGICDQCKREIIGDIIHFEKEGDYCKSCFEKIKRRLT